MRYLLITRIKEDLSELIVVLKTNNVDQFLPIMFFSWEESFIKVDILLGVFSWVMGRNRMELGFVEGGLFEDLLSEF
jgi:hypothetical protein